jgi:ferric-dicitrate binding protein FerR (iron transport regulator)
MKSLVIKYLDGKVNSKEQAELLDWLRNEGNRKEFNQVLSEWENKRLAEGIPQEHLLGWANLQSRLLLEVENKQKRQLQIYRFLSYAAIFILLISIPAVWVSLKHGKTESVLSYTQVSAENGQVAKVFLPDGSEVWLNSGSSIKYNNLFATENRDIKLDGEAFFRAAKNKDLPMIVSCSELKVKVLGTSFNVMSYPESGNIQVTLEEGKVSLYNTSAPNDVRTMQSGEMATYSKSSKQMTIDPVNTVHFTSWKDGIINIYNLSLEDLVTKLERRYNQKFEIDEAAKSLRYTFTIKNESLRQVLDLVKIINPVDPVQKNDVIYLKYNQQRATKMSQVN